MYKSKSSILPLDLYPGKRLDALKTLRYYDFSFPSSDAKGECETLLHTSNILKFINDDMRSILHRVGLLLSLSKMISSTCIDLAMTSLLLGHYSGGGGKKVENIRTYEDWPKAIFLIFLF